METAPFATWQIAGMPPPSPESEAEKRRFEGQQELALRRPTTERRPSRAGLTSHRQIRYLERRIGGAVLYRGSSGASHARAAAETLIDAALASGPASHAQADAHLGA